MKNTFGISNCTFSLPLSLLCVCLCLWHVCLFGLVCTYVSAAPQCVYRIVAFYMIKSKPCVLKLSPITNNNNEWMNTNYQLFVAAATVVNIFYFWKCTIGFHIELHFGDECALVCSWNSYYRHAHNGRCRIYMPTTASSSSMVQIQPFPSSSILSLPLILLLNGIWIFCK